MAVSTEDRRQVIRGRAQTLRYFTARLDDLNRCDPDSYLAVTGQFDAGDDVMHPCAIVYDGFRKSCVLRLGINRRRLVQQILFSAAESALCRARPLTPPAFPQTPVLPSLTPPR